MNNRSFVFVVATSIITTFVIIGIVMGIVAADRERVAAFLLGGLSQKSGGNQALSVGGDSAVVSTVEKTNPAVVSIIITKNEPVFERYYTQSPFDFFGQGFNFQIPQYRQNGTQNVEIGGGSGFFVSSDGLIVTNQHVVSDKTAQYTVYTNDGKKHAAKVVAQDATLDIAFIKISGSNYSSLVFGDSSRLKLGQSVIAIGNALGEFRNTVSVGVVSGLSRSITAGDMTGASEELDEVIQTDAAINPGNSGGPLLDLAGNVIGVNVAVAVGSQNIGFALPSNAIKQAVDSVKSHGYISYPYIGVRYTPITEVYREKNKISVDYGVIVARGESKDEPAVIPGSPADKAGIVENDIILEVDGVKLTQDAKLSSLIRSKKPGDIVVLKILHRGEEKTVQIKLEEFKQK